MIVVNPRPTPTDGVQVVPFTYTTPSPMTLQSLTSGDIIDRAVVVIETPFNGLGASVELGTTGLPGLVLAAADINLTTDDQYGSDILVEIPSPDLLILSINPSGSTQGAGYLFYRIKE